MIVIRPKYYNIHYDFVENGFTGVYVRYTDGKYVRTYEYIYINTDKRRMNVV